MAGDLEIGQLQASVINLGKSLDEIKVYLGKGIERHTEVMTKLAIITKSQDDFTEYTKQCDEERDELDKRVDSVEGFQSNQIKIAGAAGGLMGFLSFGGGKIVEKFWGLFS